MPKDTTKRGDLVLISPKYFFSDIFQKDRPFFQMKIFLWDYSMCQGLNLGSKMTIFGSLLTTFDVSCIFCCSWGSSNNWLEPKIKLRFSLSLAHPVGKNALAFWNRHRKKKVLKKTISACHFRHHLPGKDSGRDERYAPEFVAGQMRNFLSILRFGSIPRLESGSSARTNLTKNN
jgi:hypothetical protein